MTDNIDESRLINLQPVINRLMTNENISQEAATRIVYDLLPYMAQYIREEKEKIEAKRPHLICMCGHSGTTHIYYEGPCRPGSGVICDCNKFIPDTILQVTIKTDT